VPNFIKIVSCIIILLGIVHISFASPLQLNTDTLWFVGAGTAIIFAGLLNLVAIDRGGSKFTIAVAAITNTFNCAMFCFALPILNEPQVYVGIAIFLIAAIAFLIQLRRQSP
jgi:protein-S-isoprenylcysteine O-methyltransferase Ste14